MANYQEYYEADLRRFGEKGPSPYVRRLLKYLRKTQACENRLLKTYYRFRYKRLGEKHGIEIPWTAAIGKGLFLGHAYNITLNPAVTIGENCNLHKGVTIGQTNRGRRQGVPTLGNRVWVGVNATVVGKITIGDDVLIAPNSYVNCDVPSHSVVYGNPCVIKPRENATEAYITDPV